MLVAPRRWFNDRFWILPINMLEASASRLRRSITIEEGQGGQLITSSVVEPPSQKKRARKQRQRTKPRATR
ncbi:MAG: hypothetical protein ACXWNB_10970 [Candidatus Binataceae bacterium]